MALVLPLLLLVVLGIMDFGLLFQQYEVVTNAAREGARIGVLPAYQANRLANVQARVDQYVTAGLIGGGAVTTTVGGPTAVVIGGNCMETITVNVAYPHAYIFLAGIGAYFGGTFGTTTLHASSTMRLEAPAGTCP